MRIKVSELPDILDILAFGERTLKDVRKVIPQLSVANRRYQSDWDYVKHSMAEGKPFVEAVADRDMFDRNALIAMRAATEAGELERTFYTLAQTARYQRKIKNAFSSALLGPFIVLCLVTLIIPFLYEILFVSLMGTPARNDPSIMAGGQIGMWIKANPWIYGVILVTEVVLFRFLMTSRTAAEVMNTIALNIPGLRGVIVARQFGLWARFVSSLFQAGIPITQCMEMMNQTLTKQFSVAMEKLIIEVNETSDWMKACDQKRWSERDPRHAIPDLFVATLQVGGESGNFTEPLSQIAETYEEQYEESMEKLKTAIGNLATLIVSVPLGYMFMKVFSVMLELQSAF